MKNGICVNSRVFLNDANLSIICNLRILHMLMLDDKCVYLRYLPIKSAAVAEVADRLDLNS